VTSNYSFQKEVNHHSDTTNKTAIDAYITHSIFVQPGPRDFKIDRCNIEYLSEILADITIV
jgi:hypothetical protein